MGSGLITDPRDFGTDSEAAPRALAADGPAANEELLRPFFDLRALQVAAWSVLIAQSFPEKRDHRRRERAHDP